MEDELARPCSPRPPYPFNMMVARTEGYTYAAKVWALSLVQGPFSVAKRLSSDSHQTYHSTRPLVTDEAA